MTNPVVCFILLKDVSDSFPKGSLINPRDKARKSYILHPLHSGMKENSSVCSDINECDVSPVSAEDFQYLCRISEPKDRYDVFKSPYKLKWAKTLKCGNRAYAKLRKKKSTDEALYVAVEIQWVGHTKIGIKFGVEIIDSFYKGQGDASVNNFFKCAEKCGMLLDLDRLECKKLLHPMSSEAGAVGYLSDAATQVMSNESLGSKETQDVTNKEDYGNKEGCEGSRSRQDLKKEIKILKEQHRKEKEEATARQHEAEKQIAALRGQIQRELNLHRSEMEEKDDHMGEQLEKMDEIMKQLQSELFKKAANHAAEMQDVVNHREQQKRESEEMHQKLTQELAKHFQNEIKAAHCQWQQVLTQTWEVSREEIESTDVTREFPIMLGDIYVKDRDLFQLAIDCTKQSHKERYSMIEVLKKLRPH